VVQDARMPTITVKPGRAVPLPPPAPGLVRTITYVSGPSVAIGSQKMEGTAAQAAKQGLTLLLASGSVGGLTGGMSVYNGPGTVNAVVSYTDAGPNTPAAIASPASDTSGTKAAIDSIRAALRAAGITA
jgi:hypothetical protein